MYFESLWILPLLSCLKIAHLNLNRKGKLFHNNLAETLYFKGKFQ